MLIMIDNTAIQEIINISNHTSEKSVLQAMEYGVLEVYQNKKEYLKAGWTFENEDHYEILSDGKVVYFE